MTNVKQERDRQVLDGKLFAIYLFLHPRFSYFPRINFFHFN